MLIVNCRGIWPDHISLVRHCDISAAGVIESNVLVDQCGRCRDEVAGLARDETAGRPLQLEAARATASWSSGFFADAMLWQPYGLTVYLPRPTLTGVAAGVSSQSEGCPGDPCPLPAMAPPAKSASMSVSLSQDACLDPSSVSNLQIPVPFHRQDYVLRIPGTRAVGARVGLLSVLRFIPIGVFDDATVRDIGRAFDLACKQLNDSGQPDVVHEVMIKRIIAAARKGESDVKRVRDAGLTGLRTSNRR
jgi:hypothetical protein